MNDYAELGLQHGATQDEVKKAFRTMSMKYHPDRSGGDEARYKRITAAYSRLQKIVPVIRNPSQQPGPQWAGNINVQFTRTQAPADFDLSSWNMTANQMQDSINKMQQDLYNRMRGNWGTGP